MMQIIEMTDEEKTTMYMKCKKTELVKMLIECNKRIDQLIKPNGRYMVLGNSPDISWYKEPITSGELTYSTSNLDEETK